MLRFFAVYFLGSAFLRKIERFDSEQERKERDQEAWSYLKVAGYSILLLYLMKIG